MKIHHAGSIRPFKKQNYLRMKEILSKKKSETVDSGFKSRILLLLAFIFFSITLTAQNNPNEALWTENGWSLKKVVSNTSIASGVNFSYTIFFSAPAGTTSVSIQDLVPSSLQILSVTSAGPVCSVAPVTGWSGNLVTYTLSGISPSCAPMGSFTIVVKFPEGTTCNGETARNRAEILYNGKWQPTPYVSTSATAVIPWKVQKTIIAKASVNPSGGSCGYIMAPGDTITYRLAVLKDNPYFGNAVGQQNMSSALVTDILPAGAQLISSTAPVLCLPISGNISWQVNCPTQLLDASNPWAYYYVDVKVKYPVGSFPVGSQILNQATLTGVSCNQQFSTTSNQTCIQVANPVQSGQFYKSISLTNRVPGCQGMYYITFCNNGNVPLSAFNINDAIPSGITVNSIQIYGASAATPLNLNINSAVFASGITSSSYNSGTISSSVSSIQLQSTGSFPVGKCIYLYVGFTVNPNPTGTVVNNCATFIPLANTLSLNPACVSFTVEAGAPKPCLLKEICSPQASYTPGNIVRFRVRVQNIGSAALTGAAIQDALHSNFTYVGNESYFMSNTYNVGCSTGSAPPPGATAWTGVIPSHAGNNLKWNLPTIPSNCQLFYAAYCGYYGTYGIPFYFIEFDAKIDSFAMPGVTPNSYTISGGNLTGATTSNTVNVLVTASFGQEVTKFISTNNGTTWASGATVAPGGNARYRLNYRNLSNVPVSSVRLIDLLPKDALPNDDWLIFNRTVSRGSQFSVTYIGNHTTSLLPTAPAPTPAITWATGTNVCLPPYVTASCGTTTWGSTPTTNVSMNYGSFLLGSGKYLREDFDIGIPSSALKSQKACNDFAAISSANFILNGSPQSVSLTPVASPVVCLTVDSLQSKCCDSIRVDRVTGATGVPECCARLRVKCPVQSVKVVITNGTIGSVNWNCGPLPSGYVGQSSFTFTPTSCIPDMTTCVNAVQAGVVTVNYQVVFANGEKCEKSVSLDCSPVKCCDGVKIEKYGTSPQECCAKITTTCPVKQVDVKITNGVISSTSWNCGALPTGYIGQSSYSFYPNGCVLSMINCVKPNQTGLVTIEYTIYFTNGETCTKKISLDCFVQTKNCCDSLKVIKYVGTSLDKKCCVRLISKCEVKQIDIKISNGVLASTSWNCGTLPSGYIGQSSFSFYPGGCVTDMINCIKPLQPGLVTLSYFVTFANGETCSKKLELDCFVQTKSCCDSVKVEKYQGTVDCCARVKTTCEVKSVTVNVVNGSLSAVNWNCGTLPTGWLGQSSYVFYPGGCVLDMVNCVKPTASGVVISYLIEFTNGEKCEKKLELNCGGVSTSCCDSVKLIKVASPTGAQGCCARLITPCKVKGVDVTVSNGVLSSTSWNCGPLPAGYAGQSNFMFAANGCVVDMINCVKPSSSGAVIIYYTIYFENGEKCEKKIQLDCPVVKCCDGVQISQLQDECCLKLTTDCEIKTVSVSLSNGTFNNVSWNCGTITPAYVGQSSYTFSPSSPCTADMKLCLNAITTGTIGVTFNIAFANGEQCQKSYKLDCKATASCCATVNFKQKPKWPNWKTQIGTFSIVNSDPAVSICYIEITPSPSGTFTQGGLMVNGSSSAQTWTPIRIPATGNLTPSSVNTVDFSLIATGYNGVVKVCVVKCDGTRCCFEFKWITSLIIDTGVSVDKNTSSGLVAVSISPVVKSTLNSKIKYVSFGFADETEVRNKVSEFYAISASAYASDDYPSGLALTESTYMGKENAFFTLTNPVQAGDKMGYFNLVFSKKLPKLGCVFYDEQGAILYAGAISIPGKDTVVSAKAIELNGQGDMFEFINAYPNPTGGQFKVTYATGSERNVEIRVINQLGQTVKVVPVAEKFAGIHNVNIDLQNVSSGVYKVVLISDNATKSKSMVIQE